MARAAPAAPAGWRRVEPPPAEPPLHPRRGPHEPTESSPARRPGSVRRTITVDALRPDGGQGSLWLVGRARDLTTALDGSPRPGPRAGQRPGPGPGPGSEAGSEAAAVPATATAASFRFETSQAGAREILSLTTEPDVPALAALLGTSGLSGLRRRAAEAAPDLEDSSPLLAAMLDDVSVTGLISGYALTRMGLLSGQSRQLLRQADLCAGWARGATIIEAIERDGQVPLVTGPPAPSVLRPDDPLAWHELPPLPPHGMRRHRRLDVAPSTDPGTCDVDVLFRDSYQSDGGPEAVIHEYTVAATFDLATGTFTEISSTPRVLPWVECPLAAASATRLRGAAAADVRSVVRESLHGTSTCTHLNDTLRSLAAVPALAAALPGPPGPG